MAHEIFISYAGEDRAVAETVCARLEGNEMRCWMAPRDILPGDSYGKAIIDAIMESRVVILIFSAHANKSPHILNEVERAVSGNKSIVPFRIDNIHPSRALELFVSSSQWLDAYPKPEKKHFKMLADTLRHLLERQRSSVADESVNEYERKLGDIGGFRSKQEWALCVKECGMLFEKGLKHLLKDLLQSSENRNVCDGITAAQDRIGQAQSNFEEFALTQLVALYEEAEVFEELRKQLTSNLEKTLRIDWHQVAEWSKMATDARVSAALDEDASMQMSFWLKAFLYDCELVGKRPELLAPPPLIGKECAKCGEPLSHDENFCPQCGLWLRPQCAECGRAVELGWRICPHCETPIIYKGAIEQDTAEKKKVYGYVCKGIYSDRVVNIVERKMLDQMRLELGISVENAEAIEHKYDEKHSLDYSNLVEGVLVDGIIDDDERAFLQKKAKEWNIDPNIAKQIEETAIAMCAMGSGEDQAQP